MKPQEKTWSCGAAALRNALRARWGHKVREGQIRALAGTSPEQGTSEDGLIAAARALGYSIVVHSSNSTTEAWDWLRGCLISGRPVILCLDAWEHWAVCFGLLGERVNVFDSSNFKNNRKEGGIHTLDRSHLMRRWRNGRKSVAGQRRLYALAVYR